MDPEQLREFEESIRRINELLSQQSSLQAGLIKGMQDQLKATQLETKATKDNTDATKKDADASLVLSKIEEAEAKAKEKELQARQNYSAALGSGAAALTSFTNALISGEKGFTKYGNAVTSAGDAAWALGKNFGVLGMAFGGIAAVTSRVVKVQLEQLDAQVKFKDQFSKMGQISGGTTEELAKLARQAGYSYLDLEKLTKPLQTAGMALQSMNNAGQSGAETFLKMANVGKETRMRFERLGIAQEELTNMQAEYLSLQRLSGSAFRDQAKDADLLKKKSLEYANQLVELSALTGKSVEQLQAEQRQARMTFEEAVQTRQESARIRQLENEAKAAGKDTALGMAKQAEADRIRLEQESRQKFINTMSNKFGPEYAQQLAKVARTGAFTEDTKGLANLGLSASQIKKIAAGGSEEDINALSDQINQGIDRKVLTMGTSLQFAGEELGKVIGVTKDVLEQTAGQQGEAAKALADAAKASAEAQAANRDKEGKVIDAALEKRSQLTEMEIAARVKLDELVSSVSLTDTAMIGLTAAIGTAILGLISFGSSLTKAGLPGGLPGGGGMKMLARAGGVAAAGYVGWQAGQWLNENTNIQEHVASGLDTITGQSGKADETYQQGMSSNLQKKNAALKGSGYIAVEGGYKTKDGKTILGKDLPVDLKRKLNALKIPGLNLPIDGAPSTAAATATATPAGAAAPASTPTPETSTASQTPSATPEIALTKFTTGLDLATNGLRKLAGVLSTVTQGASGTAAGSSGSGVGSSGSGAGSSGASGPSGSSGTGAAGIGTGAAPGSDKKLLDFIGKIEGRGDYNILVGGKSNPELTRMTVAQVLEYQKRMLASGHESTAVGKYQIIRKTLQGLVNSGAVKLNDVFNQSTQDKAAIALMNGRGRLKFLAGKMDAETYANNLAKEWASLPMANGRSFYAGTGSNKSLVSRADFVNALKAKEGGVFSGPDSGYPIEMHGTELVAPLQKNSILMELAKTPRQGAGNVDASSALMSMMEQKSTPAKASTASRTSDTAERMVVMNTELMQMISNKLDKVIDTLSEGNDTNSKLLKRSSV